MDFGETVIIGTKSWFNRLTIWLNENPTEAIDGSKRTEKLCRLSQTIVALKPWNGPLLFKVDNMVFLKVSPCKGIQRYRKKGKIGAKIYWAI